MSAITTRTSMVGSIVIGVCMNLLFSHGKGESALKPVT